jgi:hypothetical protein
MLNGMRMQLKEDFWQNSSRRIEATPIYTFDGAHNEINPPLGLTVLEERILTFVDWARRLVFCGI